MILQKLKDQFLAELSSLYASEEVNSFFVILSEKFLGLTRLEMAMNSRLIISEVNAEKFKIALDRLLKNEPIQYIIGETKFYGLTFHVNKHTLIPRPETEELVEWILTDEKGRIQKPITILDIGTGSGCIAISLAKNLPATKLYALDISVAALRTAKENAAFNKVDIQFEALDILKAKKLPKQYDIIVSNPPYVRNQEKKQMAANVLNHEPSLALFVNNDDPLLYYRTIINLAQSALNSHGKLYFEINEYLSNDLVEMLKTKGYGQVIVKKDIFGKDRMIKCAKNESSK